MIPFGEMSKEQLEEQLAQLRQEYEQAAAQGLKLDMSRGKPGTDQLELSMPMLDMLDSRSLLRAQDGTECRNYGALDGIPEAKRLMAGILELAPDQVFVGGVSSLNLMHDCLAMAFAHGVPGSDAPWCRQPVKFICPAPGYDRHFAVSDHFGFEPLTVPMTENGPDMDAVERLVAQDASIKGIWCVPKYSNPLGITFSDETVRRMAALAPAAKDFRIIWDNAYAIHDLHPGHPDRLLNLMAELVKNGKEDMALLFTSTSKVSFPGGGISAVGASERNIAYIKKHMALQTIGYDKVNQLRHARFFPDAKSLREHMEKHAAILRPKFAAVLGTLQHELEGLDIAQWNKPNGGYFISLDVLPGCAKRVVSLCAQAGVVMTPAGATFPKGLDPEDKNIRIAPTFPNMQELQDAAGLLCLCIKLASLQAMLEK